MPPGDAGGRVAAPDGLHAQEAVAQVEQRDRRRVRRTHWQPGMLMEFGSLTSNCLSHNILSSLMWGDASTYFWTIHFLKLAGPTLVPNTLWLGQNWELRVNKSKFKLHLTWMGTGTGDRALCKPHKKFRKMMLCLFPASNPRIMVCTSTICFNDLTPSHIQNHIPLLPFVC